MERFEPGSLVDFATGMLMRGGMAAGHASAVGEVLVEADLLGHSTHGLRLLPRYLDELGTPRLKGSGAPETVADNGGSLVWDGHMLPGPSLVTSAIELLLGRVDDFGLASMVIRRSHHAACLAAYLRRVTETGRFVLITTTNPGSRSVAPFGGKVGLFASTPVACGIPTEGDPILVDLSLSTTSGNTTRQYAEAGRKLPAQWVLDRDGNPSDDPNVLREAGGTILPLGGVDLGYKGFGLLMIMHALTIGLSGMADPMPAVAGEFAVFILVIDPARFGGRESFAAAMSGFAGACRSMEPAPFATGVRMPGDNALRSRRAGLAGGLALPPGLFGKLRALADGAGLDFPAAL